MSNFLLDALDERYDNVYNDELLYHLEKLENVLKKQEARKYKEKIKQLAKHHSRQAEYHTNMKEIIEDYLTPEWKHVIKLIFVILTLIGLVFYIFLQHVV
ncbi:MAG: hypothetical protein ACFFCS_18285 [Candidatus Hodarchaeota archaeon]